MKYILNFLKGIIIFAWLVLAVFTTVCLISYNQYKVTEFGKNTLVIIDSTSYLASGSGTSSDPYTIATK